MNKERNKFLTEAMGIDECDNCGTMPPDYCGCNIVGIGSGCGPHNFSTWTGFGKLWEWAQKQEWFQSFYEAIGEWEIINNYIHPDRFADAIYQFLKERA